MKTFKTYKKSKMENAKYMNMALSLAERSQGRGDNGIGAVLVFPDGRTLSEGDSTFSDKNYLAHAEFNLINKVTRQNLRDCVLYSSLEPCAMCAWALMEAGIQEVIFGAYNRAHGFYSSKAIPPSMVSFAFQGGILAEQCMLPLSKKLQETSYIGN